MVDAEGGRANLRANAQARRKREASIDEVVASDSCRVCGGNNLFYYWMRKKRESANDRVDISTLYERYSGGFTSATLEGYSKIEKVYADLEKLCVAPDKRAVPQLARILALTEDGLHNCAAARALFCAGTPEAHQILAKYYLAEHSWGGYGFTNEAFEEVLSSKMDAVKQSEFIETYLLRNLSKNLKLTVLDKVEADNRGRLTFMVRMRNLLQSPLVIELHIGHRSHMLYFRSHAGRYIPRFGIGHVDAPPRFIRLRPGGFYDYKVPATLRGPPTTDERHYAKVSKGTSVYMDVELLGYDLIEAGRFTVRAMLETPSWKDLRREEYERYLELDRQSRSDNYSMWLCPEMKKDHEQDKSPEVVWTGRAVSQPVEIEIPPFPESVQNTGRHLLNR
ncbi:MAG: hypothetical protein WC429_10440 [Verrucomicrobiia bacterium]